MLLHIKLVRPSSALACLLVFGSCSSPNDAAAPSNAGSAGNGSAGASATAQAGTPATGGAGAGAGGSAGNAGSGAMAGTSAVDTSAVTVTGRFPEAGASVCADAALRLSFSAPVKVGSAGTLRVFKTSDPATPVASVDVALPTIQESIAARRFYKVRPIFLEGSSAVVYLKIGALSEPTDYFVTMDAGVFVDEQQKPLPAITGPNAWRFSTKKPAPLDPHQLTVSREGAGDFCSVQGAVDFVPKANVEPTTITLAQGTYYEIVYIAGKHQLTFRGAARKGSVIAYPNNDVLQMKGGTAVRALVEAEGSNGLVFENLTLHNTTPQGGSQAEALRIEPGDQVILRDADFISRQDTLLLTGRVYVKNSYIEGNVDFIWGKGAAYFESSEIKTVARPGYLVQSRNTTNHGYVFVDSTLSGDASATGTLLGRIEADRFPSSNVAFLSCKMGPHIAPQGWSITNSTGAPVESLDLSKLAFAEYQSTNLDGVLLDISARHPASRQLDAQQAAELRDKATVLGGWNPTTD
jgi:pectin methylesterase-like acyl-CoA thioesterase